MQLIHQRPGGQPVQPETSEPWQGLLGHDERGDAEALIREARRRARRRRLILGSVLVLLASGLTAGLLRATRPTRPSSVANTATPKSPGLTINPLHFARSFLPQQVVTAAGRLWVVGSDGPGQQSCAIEEIAPRTLRAHTYPIPACTPYVAVGNGQIYLAGDVPDGVFGDAFHLEIFDPTTHTATLMAPVITTTVGSEQAHMAMAFGDGWLWVAPWGNQVLQVSPSTGSVVQTITGAPDSNSGHGTVVANSGGVWLAEGPSSPGDLYRIAPGSSAASKVYVGPPSSSLLWLSTIGDVTWTEVGRYKGDALVTTSLAAFNSSGQKILQTGPERLGDVAVVGSGDRLWSVGTGYSCNDPQRLWAIGASTGKATAITTLRTPIEACLTESPNVSQLAVVDGSVFVLEATGTEAPASILYRVRTARRL
jgi:hypothetical protein